LTFEPDLYDYGTHRFNTFAIAQPNDWEIFLESLKVIVTPCMLASLNIDEPFPTEHVFQIGETTFWTPMPTFTQVNDCGYKVTQTVQLLPLLTDPPPTIMRVKEDTDIWSLAGGSEVDAGTYDLQILVQADDPLAYTTTIPFTVTALFEKYGFIPDISYVLTDLPLFVQVADSINLPTKVLFSEQITDYALLADGEALPESIEYVSETKEFKISSSDMNQIGTYDIVATVEVSAY